MIWKLFVLTCVSVTGLWMLGYGPSDLARAANDLSRANAGAISPSESSDWG
jgi:hypothetical protein